MTELMQLWQRRSELSKRLEWERLYQLVYKVLKTSKCSVLNSLPFDKKHYIDEFFSDKVYFPTRKLKFKDTLLVSDNSLHTFFCRYLSDFLDDSYLKRALPLEEISKYDDDENDNDGKKLTLEEMTELQLNLDKLSSKFNPEEIQAFLSEFDLKTAKQIFEILLEFSLDIEDARFLFLDAELKPKSVNSFLKAGLNLKFVKASAFKFFSDNEYWVSVYLLLNTCLEKNIQLPLSKLAEIYNIPAYHYKARKLGISLLKGQFEKGYEKTILGKWLLSLEISTKIENRGAIQVAFKVLCCEALYFPEK